MKKRKNKEYKESQITAMSIFDFTFFILQKLTFYSKTK